MAEQEKKRPSFYEYMLAYPHKDPFRVSLAANLRKLAPRNERVKKIDSLADLMSIVTILTDPDAVYAISGSLWCEYCTVVGRPIISPEELRDAAS